MRKLMTLALAIIFVTTAFSALAAETTFTGEYRVRAWSEYNFDKKWEDSSTVLISHDNAQYDGWFEQTFRLTVTHTRSEFLKAVIRLDLVEDTWGQQRSLRINNSTVGSFIDLAYIEFTLPTLGTFTVGRFPLQYGYGLLFSSGYETPGVDGVRWDRAFGPVALSAAYIKFADRVTAGPAVGASEYNWDSDMYALSVKVMPAEGHLIELFGGVVFDRLDDAWIDGTGNVAGAGALRNSYHYWADFPPGHDSTLGFAGVAYTGNVLDMLDIKFEYSHIFGKSRAVNVPFSSARGSIASSNFGFYPDLSVSGWNLYVDVAYYNDLLRVGAAFIMGSGEKHFWNGPSARHINLNSLREDNFKWSNILVGGTYGLNALHFFGNGWDEQLENITSAKLYFEICPIDKLSINAAVIWAKWTEPVGVSFLNTTRGNYVNSKGAAYAHPAFVNGLVGSGYLYSSWDVSDDLGWEIDFGFSYEIMEGLTYSFAAGVLFTGDSFDYEKADGTRGDWGEIWSISNTLLYEF